MQLAQYRNHWQPEKSKLHAEGFDYVPIDSWLQANKFSTRGW